MSKFRTPVGAPHSGCNICGEKHEALPMDAILAVGFGGVMVTCNDECIWQGDDSTVTVQRFEDQAVQRPGCDWQIRFDAPLWNATYQRQATEHWICVEKGQGFA